MSLKSISPIDGRYSSRTACLAPYFSEEALNKYRVKVEVEWLLYMTESGTGGLEKTENPEALRDIYINFSADDSQQIKDLERETNHDVKAVEYFVKDKLTQAGMADLVEWVHFSCTSEDINNLSYGLMLRDAVFDELLVKLKELDDSLAALAENGRNIPMLARTHGQPASPTTLGKEIHVFQARLSRQIGKLERQDFLGKFNGATGNFNAHCFVFPESDWFEISQNFITGLGLTPNPSTTQIEPHDWIAELSNTCALVNSILTDFSRDIWSYISIDYFGQKQIAGQTGSSTMPHKVNPIDFENAEGNLGLANSLFRHFSEKLTLSRWQRDLSDSTVLRNIGSAFAYMIIAMDSLQKGIGKLQINRTKVSEDLDNRFEVLGEAIQTQLRAIGFPNPYEKLKDFTRGRKIDESTLREFIENLDVPEDIRNKLLSLKPSSYIGLASQFSRCDIK